MNTVADVLAGRAPWGVRCADALAFVRDLPDDSVDLLFTSPPYRKARTYGIGAQRDTEEWVWWMCDLVCAAARKVKGLIAINCEGQTEHYRYHPTPYLLLADLTRLGFNPRRPAIFHRIGIPGSGGPDWLRADYEPVICITRPGRLPWSDNTACGHPPKWAPGGEMSNRLSSGARVNEWGGSGRNTFRMADGTLKRQTGRGSQPATATKAEVEGAPPNQTPDLFDAGERTPKPSSVGPFGNLASAQGRTPDGVKKKPTGRNMKKADKLAAGAKRHTKRGASPQTNGDALREQAYLPPVLANPGNVVQRRYTADEVASLLGQSSELVHCAVGGGQMGSGLAHENEAPFPLELAEFFVRSFCPPGGVVCDPFSGSGTTAHASLAHGRRFVGCDLRQSQVELTALRLRGVTPPLFTDEESSR